MPAQTAHLSLSGGVVIRCATKAMDADATHRDDPPAPVLLGPLGYFESATAPGWFNANRKIRQVPYARASKR
jgi:hypothetical protein